MKQRGFSLIELLIAMALLLFALTTTVLLASGNRSLSIDSQTDAEGLTLAQKFLLTSQISARKDFRLVNPTTSVETIGNLAYTKKTEVTPLSDFFTKNIKTTVTWGGTYGRTQTITLSGLVTNFENAIGGDTCYSTLLGTWSSPQTTHILFGSISGLNDTLGLYPVVSVDAYQKKLYAAVNTTNTAAGPLGGVTAINKTGTGTSAWSTPTGALVSGGATADATLNNANPISNYLWVSNFSSLAIPNGATILGIEVHVVRRASAANSLVDNQVRLIKPDGTLSSLDRADTTTKWSGSSVDVQYGNGSDLWGEKWSRADIKNTNFGVAFSAKNTGSANRTASVDYITVTVTYSKQLYVFDITNPTSPILTNYIGSNTVTTGFNAVATDGTYVYAATNSGTAPLQIIDTSVTPATVKASFNPAGNAASANTLFYKDGYVYLGLANSGAKEFNIIDVHTPGTPSLTGSFEVGAGVKSIDVRGGYAYLATDDNTREVITVSLASLFSPTFAGSYNAPGSSGFGFGQRLFTVGDTLYMGRTYVSNAPEFAILDTSNISAPSLLGSRDVGPDSTNPFGVYGVIVRDYLAFILTNSPSQGGQLMGVNISNPATAGSVSPTFSITLPNTGTGSAMDCEGNYVYAASNPTSGTFLNRSSISIVTAP